MLSDYVRDSLAKMLKLHEYDDVPEDLRRRVERVSELTDMVASTEVLRSRHVLAMIVEQWERDERMECPPGCGGILMSMTETEILEWKRKAHAAGISVSVATDTSTYLDMTLSNIAKEWMEDPIDLLWVLDKAFVDKGKYNALDSLLTWHLAQKQMEDMG